MTAGGEGFVHVGGDRLAVLAERSVEIIRANQAPTGAYLASPNFGVYRYSWLRDGAFIADSMSRAGHHDSASAFLEWCRQVVEKRVDRIDDLIRRHRSGEFIKDNEYLHTRYTMDGDEGDDDWWNHQLDGYGAWLWALGAHHSRSASGDGTANRYGPSVEATARYLAAFWDLPCYDCWEEHGDQVHVSTLAAIAAGMRVAADWPGVSVEVQLMAQAVVAEIGKLILDRGTSNGHLVKWLGGQELDASLLFCAVPYRLFSANDAVMQATVAELSKRLVNKGIYRHLDDSYFGGGEWVLLTAVLGSCLKAVGDVKGAQSKLDWVAAQANDDGWLPEQVSTHLLHSQRYEEWEQRWGPVATPLLWSHAMYLNLYHDLNPTE